MAPPSMTFHPSLDSTPSPELVQAFLRSNPSAPAEMTYEQFIATRFARWGADQELEACISAVLSHPGFEQPELFVELLRAARRPKPPSLKEQALHALLHMDQGQHNERTLIIRRALESLPD